MMGIPTKEWDDLPPPGIMFCNTSSHAVLKMDSNTDEALEMFLHNNKNANIMRVGYTILAAAEESGIDENWCLLYNQSTCNAFIIGKYLSNIRDDAYRQNPSFLCNAGVA